MRNQLHPEPSDEIEAVLDELASVKDFVEARSRRGVLNRYDREIPGTRFAYRGLPGDISLDWEDPWGPERVEDEMVAGVARIPYRRFDTLAAGLDELAASLERYETRYMSVNTSGAGDASRSFPAGLMTISVPEDYDPDTVWETSKRAYEAAIAVERIVPGEEAEDAGLYARLRNRLG